MADLDNLKLEFLRDLENLWLVKLDATARRDLVRWLDEFRPFYQDLQKALRGLWETPGGPGDLPTPKELEAAYNRFRGPSSTSGTAKGSDARALGDGWASQRAEIARLDAEIRQANPDIPADAPPMKVRHFEADRVRAKFVARGPTRLEALALQGWDAYSAGYSVAEVNSIA